MVNPVSSSNVVIQQIGRHPLLWRGCGWLLGLSVLGGNVALAQTPSGEAITVDPSSLPAIATPSAPEVAPAPIEVAPAPAAPEVVIPVEPASPLDAPEPIVGDSFIDRTNYNLGATQRGEPGVDRPYIAPLGTAPSSLPNSVAPVQVGSLNLSVTGIGWSASSGNTTPTGRAYYKRSFRPPGRLGNGNLRLMFPLSIPAPITSIFGWRVHPIWGDQRLHSGTDLGAPMGTPVLAAYEGRVALADFLGGYGLTVALEHSQGQQQTVYAHLSEIFVQPGELVKQGMVIGRVGSTGNSTGPHLHFEFRQLTQDGWVAMDAGEQLEYALAQLIKALPLAQSPSKPPAATNPRS